VIPPWPFIIATLMFNPEISQKTVTRTLMILIQNIRNFQDFNQNCHLKVIRKKYIKFSHSPLKIQWFLISK
jgi:hypothetical protein